MSGPAGNEILTREELDHLLADSAGGSSAQSDEQLAQRLPRSVVAQDSGIDAEMRLAVARGADIWGRRMASSYQRRIECSLIGWREMDLSDLAPAILDVDEAVCFSIASETGFALMSRPLFTALLGLEFGAGSAVRRAPMPRRPFTGIERRLLKRIVRDLLTLLESAWQEPFPHPVRITDTCSRDRLLECAAGKVVVASLDVSALDVVGRLRIGLPAGPLQGRAVEGEADLPAGSQRLEQGMGGVPLTLRAELGTLELTLGQIARLRVGDELTLQPSAEDGLLIRVAGKAKFKAVAGQVGSQLAAQAVERL